MYIKTDVEKKYYLDGLVNRIKVNIKSVNKTKFIILDRKGIERNLTKKFLEAVLDYFEKLNNNSLDEFDIQKTISDSDEVSILKREVLNSTNQFNSRPIQEVVSHFEQLTILKNKLNKPLLTEKQLYDYIKMAFIDMIEIPEPKMTLDIYRGDKRKINWLFYEFYNYQITRINSDSYQREKYMKLLYNYFTNFTKKAVEDNFNKPARKF